MQFCNSQSLAKIIITAFIAISPLYATAANETERNFSKYITVENAYTRPVGMAGKNAALYMDITNKSTQEIAVTGVSTILIANDAYIGQSITNTAGINQYLKVDKLALPRRSVLSLKPYGFYVMLSKLKRPLKEGDKFEITLKLYDMQNSIYDIKIVNVEVKGAE